MRINRLKIFLVLAGMVISTVLSSGCSFSDSSPHSKPGKITIGLSMATLQEERWQKDMDILVAKAKAKGADVIVQNANNSLEDQISQVKFLLSQNIDILVIVPQDSEKSQEAVQLARKKRNKGDL
ncbi:MAG TPA: D-xylose transporter subunit XylF, partial [Ruminiclostridium sp.]|nr:D-xylose transporter subunit XylF [Ruminiclostridium sp.]